MLFNDAPVLEYHSGKANVLAICIAFDYVTDYGGLNMPMPTIFALLILVLVIVIIATAGFVVTYTKKHSKSASAPVAPIAPEPTSHASSSSLWENDYLIVDEKVRAFTFGNAYGIYADGTDPVGYVRQVNISGGAKAAQIMLGSKMKAMQNIEIVITDASGSRVGGISRKGISYIAIEDAAGNVIGHLKFGKIVTDDGRVLATAKTKSLSKTSILDENGAEMAMIDHKWNGVKSLLTSADKYAVLFANDLDPAKKSNVLAICIAFDFVTD